MERCNCYMIDLFGLLDTGAIVCTVMSSSNLAMARWRQLYRLVKPTVCMDSGTDHVMERFFRTSERMRMTRALLDN
eukprot:3057362-Amphidinium_carterae.1